MGGLQGSTHRSELSWAGGRELHLRVLQEGGQARLAGPQQHRGAAGDQVQSHRLKTPTNNYIL